jgi:type II secretory pathway component GspD/PulD (secretin)
MLRYTAVGLVALSLAAPPAAGDLPVAQVLIEARVVESTPEFARRLGVDFRLGGGAAPAEGPVEGPWVALAQPVARGWLERVTGILRRSEETELLAPPKLTATAAEPATLVVGGQTPLADAPASGSAAGSADIGIQLRIAPVVGDDGTLRLELRPEVSELASGPDGPRTATRSAADSVLLGGGETVVIGGLFSDGMRDAAARMPQLADIPHLGRLFRSRRWQQGYTELLILIEPSIVDPEGIRSGGQRWGPPPAADPRLGPAPALGADVPHPPPVHPPKHP